MGWRQRSPAMPSKVHPAGSARHDRERHVRQRQDRGRRVTIAGPRSPLLPLDGSRRGDPHRPWARRDRPTSLTTARPYRRYEGRPAARHRRALAGSAPVLRLGGLPGAMPGGANNRFLSSNFGVSGDGSIVVGLGYLNPAGRTPSAGIKHRAWSIWAAWTARQPRQCHLRRRQHDRRVGRGRQRILAGRDVARRQGDAARPQRPAGSGECGQCRWYRIVGAGYRGGSTPISGPPEA